MSGKEINPELEPEVGGELEPESPKHDFAALQRTIDELKSDISTVRQDRSKDNSEKDDIIGSLKREIEELKIASEKIVKGMEKQRQRPAQTMVPPPPPPTPQEAQDTGRRMPEGLDPARPKKGLFRRIW